MSNIHPPTYHSGLVFGYGAKVEDVKGGRYPWNRV